MDFCEKREIEGIVELLLGNEGVTVLERAFEVREGAFVGVYEGCEVQKETRFAEGMRACGGDIRVEDLLETYWALCEWLDLRHWKLNILRFWD